MAPNRGKDAFMRYLPGNSSPVMHLSSPNLLYPALKSKSMALSVNVGVKLEICNSIKLREVCKNVTFSIFLHLSQIELDIFVIL